MKSPQKFQPLDLSGRFLWWNPVSDIRSHGSNTSPRIDGSMPQIHPQPRQTNRDADSPVPSPAPQERLRILMLCHSPSWGGLEREVGWLSQALAERGHLLTLGVLPDSPLARFAAEVGLATLCAKPLRYPGLRLWALIRWIHRNHPDLVHVHTSEDLRLAWLALSFNSTRTPLYLTRHMGLKHRRGGYFNRRIYQRVRRLYAISSYVAQGLRQNVPMPPDRIQILPPGIWASRLAHPPCSPAEAREQLGIHTTANGPVIGMLGRITPMKGHLEFLESLYRIRTENPKIGFQVIIAGGAGADPREQRLLETIKAQVHDYGLSDRVHLIGEVDESTIALTAMDLFIFPSHLESFGMALVEAMACGLPVVACAAGGVVDIVEHDRTGLLVPVRDVPALAQAMLRLLQDENLCRRLGQNARTAADRWDIRHIAAAYEADFYGAQDDPDSRPHGS